MAEVNGLDKGKSKAGYDTNNGNNLASILNEKEPASHNLPYWVPGSYSKEMKCLSLTISTVRPFLTHELGASEAFLLTDSYQVFAPGRFSEDLAMSDRFGNRVISKISNHGSESPTRFLLGIDFRRFFDVNQLKEGEVVCIYRVLDPVSGENVYALRCFPIPANLQHYSATAIVDKGVHFVFSKTLTSQEVHPTDPVLFLDACEAYVLSDFVEHLKSTSVPKALSVKCDRYGMLFLCGRCSSGYSLSGEFGYFVKKYNLKAGDQILFYKYKREDSSHTYLQLEYIRRGQSELHRTIDLNSPAEESELSRPRIDLNSPAEESEPSRPQIDLNIPPGESEPGRPRIDLNSPPEVSEPSRQRIDLNSPPEVSEPSRPRIDLNSPPEVSEQSRPRIDLNSPPQESEIRLVRMIFDLNSSPDDSRGEPLLVFSFTKTLSACQGTTVNIFFDVVERLALTCRGGVPEDCPCGEVLMPLLVRDEGGRRYGMSLMHVGKTGDIVCTLGGAWLEYVDSHSLKVGDKVRIAKFQGETCYHFSYERARAGASGVGLSGA